MWGRLEGQEVSKLEQLLLNPASPKMKQRVVVKLTVSPLSLYFSEFIWFNFL